MNYQLLSVVRNKNSDRDTYVFRGVVTGAPDSPTVTHESGIMIKVFNERTDIYVPRDNFD